MNRQQVKDLLPIIQNTAYRYRRTHKGRYEGTYLCEWRDSKSEGQRFLDFQAARQIHTQNLANGVREDRERDLRAH